MKPAVPRCLLAAALCFVASSATAAEPAEAPDVVEPAILPVPKPVAPPAAGAVEKAIGRGVAFLVETQNPDGSWGSAERTKELNIHAPTPGAHHAFRSAVTAMCIAALIEAKDPGPATEQALERGEAWLLEKLPQLRRSGPTTIYNNWSHAYGLQALVRMLGRKPDDAPRRERIGSLIAQQIEMLVHYEAVDGGWGYLDDRARAVKLSTFSAPFMSGTILVALHEAQQAGFATPRPVLDRALESIRRQRKPDGSYLYGWYMKYQPMRNVNRPAGSLGRSQVCNIALRLWGDAEISDETLTVWLNRIYARNLWLDLGRKKPIPHDSWFQVAGYFFFYGHYYGALCIRELPPEQQRDFHNQLAHVLLPLQEKDGSWWDYPLYNYHQPYGTAFAILSLVGCRAEAQQN